MAGRHSQRCFSLAKFALATRPIFALTCSAEIGVTKAQLALAVIQPTAVVWEQLVFTLGPEGCIGGGATKAHDGGEGAVDRAEEVVDAPRKTVENSKDPLRFCWRCEAKSQKAE